MKSRDPEDRREAVKQRVNRFLLGLADSLTLIRLLATPLVIYLLYRTGDNPLYNWYALSVIFVLQTTDVLDGYLARQAKRGLKVHTLGEVLDPIADKLYINGAVITLMIIGRLPVWAGGLIILRDVLIIGGWLVRYWISGVRLLPNKLGKAADTSLALLLLVILLQPPHAVLLGFLWLAVILTVLSGFSYLFTAIAPPAQASE